MSDGLQSSLFFETPEEIFARVYRELKPRTPLPDLRIEFCQFANADSFIRLKPDRLISFPNSARGTRLFEDHDCERDSCDFDVGICDGFV